MRKPVRWQYVYLCVVYGWVSALLWTAIGLGFERLIALMYGSSLIHDWLVLGVVFVCALAALDGWVSAVRVINKGTS